MKTSVVYWLAIFIGLGLGSCSSSDDSSSPSGQEGITFKVEGTSITPDDFEAVLYTNSVAGGLYIDVFGYVADDMVVEFHFPAKTGSFSAQQSFDMTSSWLTYLANGGTDYPGDFYHSTAGTINVTVCDTVNNKLEANFSFTGNNTITNKEITNGNLKINAITHQ